jgi:hypothetical protein
MIGKESTFSYSGHCTRIAAATSTRPGNKQYQHWKHSTADVNLPGMKKRKDRVLTLFMHMNAISLQIFALTVGYQLPPKCW